MQYHRINMPFQKQRTGNRKIKAKLKPTVANVTSYSIQVKSWQVELGQPQLITLLASQEQTLQAF